MCNTGHPLLMLNHVQKKICKPDVNKWEGSRQEALARSVLPLLHLHLLRGTEALQLCVYSQCNKHQ